MTGYKLNKGGGGDGKKGVEEDTGSLTRAVPGSDRLIYCSDAEYRTKSVLLCNFNRCFPGYENYQRPKWEDHFLG
jgi:hypothetical protein